MFEYFHKKIIESLRSNEYFKNIFVKLYPNIEGSSNHSPIKDIFLLKSDTENKHWLRPLTSEYVNNRNFNWYSETLKSLLKNTGKKPSSNVTEVFHTQIMYQYTNPEDNATALCFMIFLLKKNTEIEDLLGYFKNLIDEKIVGEVVKKLEEKYEFKTKISEDLVKLVLMELKRKLELSGKYLKPISAPAIYLTDIREELKHIMYDLIDQIIEENYENHIKYLLLSESYIGDINDYIFEILYSECIKFIHNKISKKEVQITLYVLDQRKSVRDRILNKFRNFDHEFLVGRHFNA